MQFPARPPASTQGTVITMKTTKDHAVYRAHPSEIFRRQKTAAIVNRARTRAVGRDDAHDAELQTGSCDV
jgi:hypothetical protein